MPQPKIGAEALNLLFSLLCFVPAAKVATTAANSNITDGTAMGFSLELIDRDSSANLTNDERLERLLKHSDAHVQFLKSSSLKKANATALLPPVYESSRSYMVVVRIGTGASQQDYLLELDTASGLTWTQCAPCNPCFRQQGRLFEPTGSPTYRRVPCSDPLCRPPRYDCVNNVCTYDNEYTDMSSIKGKLSRETFAFQTGGGRGDHQPVAGLAFGCSHANRMNYANGKIAGLLGMNGVPESFAAQLAGITDGRFSYCLVPFFTEGHSGYLRFGRDIVMRGPVQETPLEIPASDGNYYLSLLDISVGTERVRLDPRVFMRHADGSGGVIIDCDTTIGYLVKPAFLQVRQALLSYFRKHDLAPVRGDLGTCFPLRSGVRRLLPSMTFHFRRANMEVDGEHMFYIKLEEEVFCWTVKMDESATMIGAAQQSNKRFMYDLRRRMLSFVPEDCARDARRK